MSYHISTTGMRFKNIAQVAIFTELVRKKLPVFFQKNSIIDIIANKRSFSLRMLGSPKYNEKTEEHIRVKKAIRPKDGTIFDFMIRPPNDESEVVKSPLLDIPEPEVKRFPMENNIVNETTEAEFEVVETLLKEAGIEGYSLSYPSIPASLSNVSTTSNSASVVSLTILFSIGNLLTSGSGISKRGLFTTSDSSLGGRIMKSKIVPSFGRIAFFTRICSSVF